MFILLAIVIFFFLLFIALYIIEESHLKHIINEKELEKKLAHKFVLFPSLQWFKIKKQFEPSYNWNFYSFNEKILRYDDLKLFKCDKEITSLNIRIKTLHSIIDNFKGGKKEYLAIKDEIKSLSADLDSGMYFKKHRNGIFERIEEIDSFLKSYIVENPLNTNLVAINEHGFLKIYDVLDNIQNNFPNKNDIPMVQLARELLTMSHLPKIGDENSEKIKFLVEQFNLLLIEKDIIWCNELNKDDVLAAQKIKEKMASVKQ